MKKIILRTLIYLILIQINASGAYAQKVYVRILKVPGWERLIRGFQEAGMSASIYGSADRPAIGYQVVVIGSDVPSETAISALKLIQNHLSSMKYIILAGDHPSIATKSNEITVGATNNLMDDFPDSRELDQNEIRGLIRRGEERKDLFYCFVQGTYLNRAGNQPLPGDNVKIREDGVLVFPNPDGSALLISPKGKKGYLTPDGEEQWPMSNFMEQKPVQEADVLNQEWLNEMENWLGWIGDRQFGEIELLLGDSISFNNYKAFENKNCKTIYERIHMRRKYITQLISR